MRISLSMYPEYDGRNAHAIRFLGLHMYTRHHSVNKQKKLLSHVKSLSPEQLCREETQSQLVFSGVTCTATQSLPGS